MQHSEGALKYNSELEPLIIPEYGRHVQNLVQYASTIDDKEKQLDICRYIIKLMGEVGSYHGKVTPDIEMKLWRHLVIISDYTIDQVPDGMELPSPETRRARPNNIHYPRNTKRFRHYGVYIQDLISKALEEENQEKRHSFFSIIASYMKTAYMVWNRDLHINDEAILEDLKNIVDGRGPIPENLKIEAAEINLKPLKSSHGDGKRRNNKKSSNNKHRRRKRR